MIKPECIENVKAAVNIVEVIGGFINLKKVSQENVACCPFHDERTPSFKVSKSKGIYKCFGCGKQGDAISFLMDYNNMNYIDAIKWLADKYFITLEEDKPTQRQEYKAPKHHTAPVNKFLSFFKERGISEQTIHDLNVTQGREWMPKAEEETDVICFNYYRKDELINVKYRGDNKDFKLSKGAELIFYNLNAATDDLIVITEGEIDCLSIHEAGIKSVISVPNGAAKGNQKLQYLDNCWEMFQSCKRVVLMVDNDEPGIMLRDELARRIGKEKCYKVDYPEGCKDANDILTKLGAQQLVDAITYAIEYPIEGILSMNDMYDDILSYYEKGYPQGVKLGIPEFDNHISFMPGQFTTITGIPGSGKSEWTDYMMVQSSINHGWSWAVCSFENQPSSLHATKLMEKFTGKSFAPRYDYNARMNPEEFTNSALMVAEYFHFVNINQVDVTLDGILHKARELVVRKGIKGLLIDPWNYIEHKVAYGQTETQYISECLTKIKAFALINGIHIFLIAHPTKLKKENNKYEVPTMYSISGSAHFFNKTDNGLTIYRNFDTNLVDIHVQKVRYSWLGKIGLCTFMFNTETRQYQLVNN